MFLYVYLRVPHFQAHLEFDNAARKHGQSELTELVQAELATQARKGHAALGQRWNHRCEKSTCGIGVNHYIQNCVILHIYVSLP